MDVSIGTVRGMKGKRDRFEAEGRSRELIVFSLVRESKCSECNKELWRGEFLFKDGERGLCMTCADLDELVYLPSGDAALSRRARMYSPLSAVVVRFSRARKRYERQGILVSEVALEQAEAECLADSKSRALRRERNAERRAQYDRDLVAQMTGEISRLFPGCPPKVAQPSQNIRRAGAAEGSDALPPASRSRRKRSPLPWSRTFATVTPTTTSF